MPPGSTWLNRDKARPFTLATPCSTAEDGLLVYGSTRDTEARHGAAYVEVAAARTGLNRNGLLSRTYFYPGILLLIDFERLPPQAGYLGLQLEALRTVLRVALGIGQGSCLGAAAPAGSRRGRIVERNRSVVESTL